LPALSRAALPFGGRPTGPRCTFVIAETRGKGAERASRPVLIAATAQTSKAPSLRLESPADARIRLAAITPQPFTGERATLIDPIRDALGAETGGIGLVWLSDGLARNAQTAGEFANTLKSLAADGSYTVIMPGSGTSARALSAQVSAGGKLTATVAALDAPATGGTLQAFSARNEQLAEVDFAFPAGEREATVTFELPLELRNQVTRIAIAGERSAGAVYLLDRRSQWNRIALLSGETREKAQPLLGPLHYIEKALAPYAELIRPSNANLAQGVDNALERNASIMMMADIGTLTGRTAEAVADWVEKGGVLVRFAGPRLEKGGDELLPAPLRIGGRTLGGALSWSEPQPLAEFSDTSLFAGLDVPGDVRINRQVLAEPTSLTENVSVLARLKDGTPLVTAAARGKGQVVLFHVTANSDWSNLPLSGLFVEMLRRITTLGTLGGGADEAAVASSQTSAAASNEDSGAVSAEALPTLPPIQTLDGFGALRPPPPTARALDTKAVATTIASLDHPPGYYGTAANPRSINILSPGQKLIPLEIPAGVDRRGFTADQATELKPWLLSLALALLLVDVICVLLIQSGGHLFGPGGVFGFASGRTARAGASSGSTAGSVATLLIAPLAAATILLSATPPLSLASAQPMSDIDIKAMQATAKVTLGYVMTGDAQVDETSRQGLSGLSRVLTLRSAVIPGDPMPVDINEDIIAFYPVLYWPVLDTAETLPEETVAKIDAYMKQGGMIIFDTRDYGLGSPASLGLNTGNDTPLQRILSRLDLPRLEPVPPGHVLTKSFYLLNSFPGRWDGGELWVEAGGAPSQRDESRAARRADGVTSIMITSNDFASAWAIDERGRPYYPTVPGGEMQREMAFRTGINIVMHALTGNYKADQVHVPALLQRLGQ